MGCTTDIGPRFKIIWKKPWINSYGHSLENNLSLSTLEHGFDISYKIPLLHSPLEEYYLIQGGYIQENLYDCRSDIITANIARYWNIDNNWQRVVNLNGYINYFKQNNYLMKTVMLICPGITMNRVQRYGGIVSCWVHNQRYSVNISTNHYKPDIYFIVLQAQNIWIRTLFSKHCVLIRNNLSWMETNNLPFTIPVFRFFFTKDRVIRGYKYQFCSMNKYSQYINKNVTTKLITNTIEYQYNMFGKWWGVIFLDAGEITNNIKWKNFRIGTGIGIRWKLPVGFLKADIAIPLINKINMDSKFFHFYMNLGSEL